MTTDPEFTRLLIRVFIVGGSIALIGLTVLILAFRSFRGSGFRASLLVAVLLAFVLVCCVILLRFSILR